MSIQIRRRRGSFQRGRKFRLPARAASLARATPYVLCSYDVDCEDIADLRSEEGRAEHGVALEDLACAWGDALVACREPASWGVVRRLLADGRAGALVQSFANGATPDDHNLVLWRWGPTLPHKVMVYDPTGKLSKNQLSWP
ncbi:MAG TPA: RES domain-containing protein [Caulobacteraceae bacterium]|jgi:RES domain-containing protein|nr:RES domain-containing protein [Caulobacteraceae bacterium]